MACEHGRRPDYCDKQHSKPQYKEKRGRVGNVEIPEVFRFNEDELWKRNYIKMDTTNTTDYNSIIGKAIDLK